MGDAQRGDDAIYFYAANLGRTERLNLNTNSVRRVPANGALSPGRYLLHIADLTSSASKVWVAMGKFGADGTGVNASADVPNFPMHLGGIIAIEVNVRKNDNDQIAAIVESGTATLFITQISRGA